MPSVPTYIRGEDYPRYLEIKKTQGWAEFIHQALKGTPPSVKSTKSDKVPAPIKIPGVITADKLAEPECPRHHVPRSQCADRH